jgi:hypothetical protein
MLADATKLIQAADLGGQGGCNASAQYGHSIGHRAIYRVCVWERASGPLLCSEVLGGRIVGAVSAVVRTVHGELHGRVAEGGYAFLGLPYAAAPFGANRFPPPQPVKPWDGVRDASQLGPDPPQLAQPGSIVSGWLTETGEDRCSTCGRRTWGWAGCR